jgi:hypothetical protein
MSEDDIIFQAKTLYGAGLYEDLVSLVTDSNYNIKYNTLIVFRLLEYMYFTGTGVEYNATLAYFYAKKCKSLYGQSKFLEIIESEVGEVAPFLNELAHPIRSDDYNQFLHNRIYRAIMPLGSEVLKDLMILYRWCIDSGLKHLVEDEYMQKWCISAMIPKEDFTIAKQYVKKLGMLRSEFQEHVVNSPAP